MSVTELRQLATRPLRFLHYLRGSQTLDPLPGGTISFTPPLPEQLRALPGFNSQSILKGLVTPTVLPGGRYIIGVVKYAIGHPDPFVVETVLACWEIPTRADGHWHKPHPVAVFKPNPKFHKFQVISAPQQPNNCFILVLWGWSYETATISLDVAELTLYGGVPTMNIVAHRVQDSTIWQWEDPQVLDNYIAIPRTDSITLWNWHTDELVQWLIPGLARIPPLVVGRRIFALTHDNTNEDQSNNAQQCDTCVVSALIPDSVTPSSLPQQLVTSSQSRIECPFESIYWWTSLGLETAAGLHRATVFVKDDDSGRLVHLGEDGTISPKSDVLGESDLLLDQTLVTHRVGPDFGLITPAYVDRGADLWRFISAKSSCEQESHSDTWSLEHIEAALPGIQFPPNFYTTRLDLCLHSGVFVCHIGDSWSFQVFRFK